MITPAAAAHNRAASAAAFAASVQGRGPPAPVIFIEEEDLWPERYRPRPAPVPQRPSWTQPAATAPTTAAVVRRPPGSLPAQQARPPPTHKAGTAAAALQLSLAVEMVARTLLLSAGSATQAPAAAATQAPAAAATREASAKPRAAPAPRAAAVRGPVSSGRGRSGHGEGETKAGPTLPLNLLPAPAPTAACAPATAKTPADAPTTFASRRPPTDAGQKTSWDAMLVAFHTEKDENKTTKKRSLTQVQWYKLHADDVPKRARSQRSRLRTNRPEHLPRPVSRIPVSSRWRLLSTGLLMRRNRRKRGKRGYCSKMTMMMQQPAMTAVGRTTEGQSVGLRRVRDLCWAVLARVPSIFRPKVSRKP